MHASKERWPRSLSYYTRSSGWAGRKKTTDGQWILDSVAANAAAHYLHNMFFVAGDALNTAASPCELEVETYRANSIEMYDTCALRGKPENNAVFLYIASHAVSQEENHEPEFLFEFENGSAWCRQTENGLIIEGKYGGVQVEYGYPNCEDTEKLMRAVRVAEGKDYVICGAETASVHTKCINAIEELIPKTPVFPESIVVRTDEYVYVEGLAKDLERCYENETLPFEEKFFWAKEPKRKNMRGYCHFLPTEQK